jgi:hypothetical protein
MSNQITGAVADETKMSARPKWTMIDGSNSGNPLGVLNCNMLSKSFFRSLFHTREKVQTPLVSSSEPEFPELVPVSYYHIALQSTAYISNPKINSHKVVELVRFKTTTRSGYRYKKQVHEQVVAKVETGEPGVYGYLCIERAQTRLCYNTLENLVSNSSPSIHFEKLLDSLIDDGMPISEAGTILHKKRVREQSLHTHSEDSSTNASTRNAYSEGSSESSVSESTRWSGLDSTPDDTVSRLSGYQSGKRLETLRPTNLRLCDLAILVGAVHDLNALYSIFHAQRWWFANLIMRIVEKDHETLEPPAPVRGMSRYGLSRYSKDEVCSEAGRWYKLRVDRTLLVIVGMIRLQYYEGRRKFDKRVITDIWRDIWA